MALSPEARRPSGSERPHECVLPVGAAIVLNDMDGPVGTFYMFKLRRGGKGEEFEIHRLVYSTRDGWSRSKVYTDASMV